MWATIQLRLVPTWRNGWKWFSVWFGSLDVTLATVQTISQAWYSDSSLAEYTHTAKYHLAMLLITALALASRFVHQPLEVSTSTSTSTSTSPTSPEKE